jgi:ATP-dependent helicase/nuclease subunit B
MAELPGGATLVGKIDRVDAAGDLVRVVDYKSRPRPFHPADVDLGLEWQLPLYLGAAGGEPAAMLYQPAQEPMVATDGPLPPDEAARRSRGALRASGLLSRAALEASGIGAGLLPVRLRQDGQPTADSSVADPAELAGLLAATRRAAAEVAGRVAAGDIAIRPWRRGRETACQRCLYAAVCRFDPRIAGEGFRELD